MPKITDTVIWLIMVSGALLTIGLAISAVPGMPANLRTPLLGGYFVVVLMFGYAAVAYLDVLLMTSNAFNDSGNPRQFARKAGLKRAIGLTCGGLAFVLLIFLKIAA